MHKKILITGASGFIGSHLVDEAIRRGYEVYAGMRAGSSRAFLLNDGIRFFPLDLASPSALESQFKSFHLSDGGFDYVIHNAGITKARTKNDFHRVNALYTRNLGRALLDAGCPPEKFLLISSLAVSGPGNPAGSAPIRLSDAEHPLSAYAASKLAAEKFIKAMPGLHYIIVRPTAVYGPRDKDFLSFFSLINKGMEPYIGSHRQLLSFVYVKDLSRMILAMLAEGRPGTTYMVSDGKVYGKEDLGTSLKIILGRTTVKMHVPYLPLRAGVYCLEKIYSLFGRLPFLHLDKIKEISAPNWSCETASTWQEFGTQPDYDLESGLRETAEWYIGKGWLKKTGHLQL